MMLFSMGCQAGEQGAGTPTMAAPETASPTASGTAAASVPSPRATLDASPLATVTPSSVTLEPIGYPLDPAMATNRVVGTVGARTIVAGAGASVRTTSEMMQVSDDPVTANADGWNCRTHVAYEGQPAVDWYVPPGTPVRATMDGAAMLIINTTANAFDYYGVSREPYIGDPDRARAPVSPFAGPGGGMGVYVSVVNDAFRTDYGHLELAPTIATAPEGAFGGGYRRASDYTSLFGVPRSVSAGDIVATWRVRRGDVIGYTGDSGYSEAPHLHYAITRRSDGARLCATSEPGFGDAGWLSR
jgi:hypothetical protein